jgi:drug/metabolite transporter (DMT)-like permease
MVAKRTVAAVPPVVVNAFRNVGALGLFVAYAWWAGATGAVATGALYTTIVVAAFLGPFLHSLLYLSSLSHLDLVRAALVAQTQPLFVLAFSAAYVYGFAPASVRLAGAGHLLPGALALVGDLSVLPGVVVLVIAGARKPKPKPAG